MKALQPAKVKEVRIDDESQTAEVIVPDFQLSLAIGKEGQNARLATRLTGLRIDIRSETEIAEQEAYDRTYSGESWADGAWVVNEETGEQMWQPADGGPALTLEQWEAAQADQDAAEVESEVADAAADDIAAAVEEAEEIIAEVELEEEAEELAEVDADELEAELVEAAEDAVDEAAEDAVDEAAEDAVDEAAAESSGDDSGA